MVTLGFFGVLFEESVGFFLSSVRLVYYPNLSESYLDIYIYIHTYVCVCVCISG